MLRKFPSSGRKQAVAIPWNKVAYFFLAWNAFAIVAWQYFKKKNTFFKEGEYERMTPTQRYLKMTYSGQLGQNKATVITFKGLNVQTKDMELDEYINENKRG